MQEPEINSNPAPVTMVRFLADLLDEGPAAGRVVAVDVDGGTYRVTVSRPDHGRSFHQLSAWVVSRSLRGDPAARAAIRADLLGDTSH